MKIKVNDKAPEFEAIDQDEKLHNLSDYKKKWLLLYFYPKDDTPGCTKEACAIRDNYSKFKRIGAKVLGVSTDSLKSHNKFAIKYDLPFPLLVDDDKRIVKAYGAWGKKKFMGREYMGINRISFLISPQGKIKKIYEDVSPEEHAEEVLEDLKVFKK